MFMSLLVIDSYLNRKSDAEFQALIRKEVGPYLYSEGQGKTINEWDYIQYRKDIVDDKKVWEILVGFHSRHPGINDALKPTVCICPNIRTYIFCRHNKKP